MTDRAFIEMFEEVFFSEDEVPDRQDLINLLTEATSEADPVILQYIK